MPSLLRLLLGDGEVRQPDELTQPDEMLHVRRWAVVESHQPTPQIVDNVSEQAFDGQQSNLGDEIVGVCVDSSADYRGRAVSHSSRSISSSSVVCRSRRHTRGVCHFLVVVVEHRDNMALRPPALVPLFFIAWWVSKLLLCCVILV